MTKLFKDATAGELHEMAKGLRAHIIDGLGFVDASARFEINGENVQALIRGSDDSKGIGLCKQTNLFHYTSYSLDDSVDSALSELWSEANKIEPADKRHLRAMMRQLGDTLEASEAYQSASVEAFRERIRAMRDDMGARLIEGPKS